jgi:carbon monoxide dehydrogenase subunit G
MPFRIEEHFEVQAPAARVLSYLTDPREVVQCMPGVELVEVVDERIFHGNVRVKVGPVSVVYKGRIHLDEVDAAQGLVRMTGEGREQAGAGSARMKLEGRVTAGDGGATRVAVQADVDVAGRLVQLGRGMIEQVAHQLFLDFAGCVRRTLEQAETDKASAAAPGPPRAAEPVRALPLVFRALWASIRAFFRRLLGRAPKKQ